MPLMKGKSKAAFSHNVAAEMHAGKPQDQALAIAYAQKRKMAMGGDVGGYAEGGEVDDDHSMMMDQCAMECMEAIESKDKAKFKDAFDVLVADILHRMEAEESEE